ncbi:hypothetical protein GLYMA_09G164400v4 [Glycine max]|uniref:Uncharacterized protein n=1 Tax=Glycine max TaxID=3847 RepID=A0A0R0ID77_SOYBN|nr:hypothetical protein GYH30_025252 [Glycine max]KRH38882.1 hypothetical protein GLYMA_09G164400v4 [Glycine max]
MNFCSLLKEKPREKLFTLEILLEDVVGSMLLIEVVQIILSLCTLIISSVWINLSIKNLQTGKENKKR